MTARPQTIQIFLPAGDPSGLRMAEVTTRIVRVFEVPRKVLDEFLAQPEATQVGVYFLVGEGDDATVPTLYIGQTGNVGKRLSEHNEKKDFWTRALVAVSLTNNLTQTHATFLEWYCLKQAKQAGRYKLDNGNAGTKPHTPLPLEADCLEIFDTLRTLVATLGHPLFDPVAKPADQLSASELFLCTSRGAAARAEYTSEGLVMLEGSTGPLETVTSFKDTSEERFRKRLLDSGVLTVSGDRVVLAKDHIFRTPSAAAGVISGCFQNGWTAWKTADGRTLHQVMRQPAP